nr:S8 family serine peptidase [Acuticoccus kalidii]
MTLGIVDTGINPEHETLAGADVTLLTLPGAKPQVSKRSHGTAVAAILVGSGDERVKGLLPRAKLVAIDAFEEDTYGRTHSDAYRLISAIDLIVGADPDVLNLSLAGPDNALLKKAVAAVDAAGIVAVAAVGNDGPSAPPRYPAAYESVVAVTAVDENGRVYRRSVRGDHVDFSAPGVGIWTAASVRGAKPKTGTSFAAPFVSAALALALETEETRGAAIEALRAASTDLGDPGRDPVYGWGLINAAGLCPAKPITTATAQ